MAREAEKPFGSEKGKAKAIEQPNGAQEAENGQIDKNGTKPKDEAKVDLPEGKEH